MSITLQIFSANTSLERAAEDREVLREDAHRPAEDGPVAGHDGIAPGPLLAHPELDLAVAHEAVELDERARVEQPLDPLAREQLAARVLRSQPPSRPSAAPPRRELLEPPQLRLRRSCVVRSSRRPPSREPIARRQFGRPPDRGRRSEALIGVVFVRRVVRRRRLGRAVTPSRPLGHLALRRRRRAGSLLVRPRRAPERRSRSSGARERSRAAAHSSSRPGWRRSPASS